MAVSAAQQLNSSHNHFNPERHLYRREVFKQTRSKALAMWRQLIA
jgi:putative transposase